MVSALVKACRIRILQQAEDLLPHLLGFILRDGTEQDFWFSLKLCWRWWGWWQWSGHCWGRCGVWQACEKSLHQLFGHVGLLRKVKPGFESYDQAQEPLDDLYLRIDFHKVSEHGERSQLEKTFELFQRKRLLFFVVELRC